MEVATVVIDQIASVLNMRLRDELTISQRKQFEQLKEKAEDIEYEEIV